MKHLMGLIDEDLTYDSGLTAILHCCSWTGIQAIILERFVMQDWLETIQKHKCTFGYVVPPIVLGLAKDPMVEKYDLSSIKMINSGAAPYDPVGKKGLMVG